MTKDSQRPKDVFKGFGRHFLTSTGSCDLAREGKYFEVRILARSGFDRSKFGFLTLDARGNCAFFSRPSLRRYDFSLAWGLFSFDSFDSYFLFSDSSHSGNYV